MCFNIEVPVITNFLNRASNVVAWENRVKDKDIREGEIVLQQLSMNDTDF